MTTREAMTSAQAPYAFSSTATLIWKTDKEGNVVGVVVMPHYDTHEIHEQPNDDTMPDGEDVMYLADDMAWAFPDSMCLDDGKVVLEWSC